MANYCEDYPCCGHTDLDPCPSRGVPATEPWYCDYCGYNHVTISCPNDDFDDEWDDEPYDEGYYYSGTGEWSEDDSYIDYLNRY